MTEIMKLEHLKFSVEDGVAMILVDVQGESMNVLSPKVADDFERVLNRVESDEDIRAVVIGSGKSGSFVAGADISIIPERSIRRRGDAASQGVAIGLSARGGYNKGTQ